MNIPFFSSFCIYIIRHISQSPKSYFTVLFPREQKVSPILIAAFVGFFFFDIKLCVVGKDFFSLIWMWLLPVKLREQACQ